LADKTKAYWFFTICGYTINLFSVPLLAFAPSWQWASLLILSERLGKSIRTPSRDALLSFATKKLGHGKGFGIHEFLDQVGALLGPLWVSFVLLISGNYKTAFLSLGIPALLAIVLLLYTRLSYKEEVIKESKEETNHLGKPFFSLPFCFPFCSSWVCGLCLSGIPHE